MPAPAQGAKRRIDSSSTPRTANPPGKRSRVSRACDQCRTAREKCDGQPVCSSCAASKRTCTYTANPKKRGIQPGYIRTLELALTWLFNNSDAESVLNRKLAQEGASSVLLERDTKESNKLHKSWRRTKFCRDVDKLLAGEDITEEDRRSPDTEDQDSEIEDAPRQTTVAPNTVNHAPVAREPSQVFTHDHLRTHQPLPDEAILLPPERWRLFDIYFAYTHCWFPICEKHDILKLSYSYPEDGLQLSPNMPSSGDHAELWSILALASLQDSDSETAIASPSTGRDLVSPERIYNVARMLVPIESGSYSLGHVKALLLLALFNISQSFPESAWLLVGHASRVLISLEEKNFAQVARFKHVFSGCFLLDNFVSLQLSRKPYLRPSDIERIGKAHEDGLEEWQPWTGCSDAMTPASQSRAPSLTLSTFNCLIELISIMSMSGAAASPHNNLQEVAATLEAWKMSLSPSFAHIFSGRSIPSTPQALLLQVSYHCCSMVMFSSQTSLQLMLDALERSQNRLGWCALSPVINCLLGISAKQLPSSGANTGIPSRLHFFSTEFNRAWRRKIGTTQNGHRPSPDLARRAPPAELSNARSRPSFGANYQAQTPESIQHPPNHLRSNSSVMGDSIPEISPSLLNHQPRSMDFTPVPNLQGFQVSPFDNSFGGTAADQWNQPETRNMESFFDDLASLDGAERVETQPQFMQNLGFAPDANIADLLTSDYGPLASMLPPYTQQQAFQEAPQLGETQFFDGT